MGNPRFSPLPLDSLPFDDLQCLSFHFLAATIDTTRQGLLPGKATRENGQSAFQSTWLHLKSFQYTAKHCATLRCDAV